MSIEGTKQQLADLAGKVDALAQEEISIIQGGRFGSLPERFTEIKGLAERLDGLLGVVSRDLWDYQSAVAAYYESGHDRTHNYTRQVAGPRCAELAREADVVLRGNNRAISVTSRIEMMGEPFGVLQEIGKNGLIGMSTKIENYRTTVRRVGTFSEEMAGFLAERRETIPEAITARSNEVKEVISDIATGLTQGS